MLRALAAHLDALTASAERAAEALRRHNLAARRSARGAAGQSAAALDEDIRRGRASATLTTLRRRVPVPRSGA
jgi:hypothetical protein